MRGRTLADIVLVVLAGVIAYTETFGWSDPAAGLEEIIALFTSFDTSVYLVIAGVLGTLFVGYVAVYLPKRVSQQSVTDQQG